MLRKFLIVSVVMFLMASAPSAWAGFVVAGSLQTEQGDPGDWDPPNSSLLMVEAPAGVHAVTANNLTNGTLYEFKILDDEGTPPANWGDPEVTPANIMAYGDLDGSVQITANANLTNSNGKPVIWVNTDNAPFQVVGNFMDEAGGAGDWNPADPLFAMTAQGGGYYTYTASISLAGSYEFKATDGTGWDRQVGSDGYSNNAATVFFTTTSPNELVTLFVDVANGALGVVPEPSTLFLGLSGLIAIVVPRRR